MNPIDAVMSLPQRLVQTMAGVALKPRPFSEVWSDRVRLMRLYGVAPRWMAALHVTGLVLLAAGPTLLALAVGWLVGALSSNPAEPSALTAPLVVFAAILLLQQTGDLLAHSVGVVLARQIDRRLRHRLRTFALTPARIDHLESSEYQNELRRASDQGISWRVRSPGTAVTGQMLFVFRFLAGVGAVVVVATFSAWLAVGLLCGALIRRAIVRTQWIELAVREDGYAAEKRQTSYWADLASGEAAAKEVRLFGLGEWVVRRRSETEEPWVKSLWRSRGVVYGRQIWVMALALVSAAAALALPGLAVLSGDLGFGGLAMVVSASFSIFSLSMMGHEQFDIERGIESVRAYDRLDPEAHAVDRAAAGSAAPQAGRDRPPSIVFDDVGYRYPSGTAPILGGLTLELEPGKVTAIVGENGAGKTTMMKLLSGLYSPTAGRIRVDGADLAEMDAVAWRTRLAVLFQDFIQYPLSAAENISLGAGEATADEAAMREAVGSAGAAELVASLPDGVETPLSRSRSGGTDLSGGQWQRLALARLLYAVRRGADVVVLDEPTAHLDVQAEARFFDDVIAAVGKATVVLISHRMSTVRQADRIVLLQDGRISESGDHNSLMDAEGRYARMFALQAARFTETATVGEETS